MLTNFHTHSTFCDGKNTPEEIVRYAIDRGFDSIGFSGHVTTPFDLRYCMTRPEDYVTEINRIKQKYGEKIDIYLGMEEDAHAPRGRAGLDYVIGSSHYFESNGEYYPIDSSYDYFKKCLELFDYDIIRLAEAYYNNFYRYILQYKPDIIGHYDLITKFEEIEPHGFFGSGEYTEIALKYARLILQNTNAMFEVNTGAISRGFRKTPYPHETILHMLKKEGGRLILSSDSHHISTLDFEFDNSRKLLKHIGFDCVYTFSKGETVKDYL